MVAEYMHTVRVLREAKAARSDFVVLAGMEDQILPALQVAGLLPVRRGP
jgi:hypothetical protein